MRPKLWVVATLACTIASPFWIASATAQGLEPETYKTPVPKPKTPKQAPATAQQPPAPLSPSQAPVAAPGASDVTLAGGAKKYSTRGLPPPPAPANCKTVGTFDAWMAAFRKEALAEGISAHAVSAGLSGLTYDATIISRDRKQGFFAQSFSDFSAKLATNNRVQTGRAVIKKNAAAFARVDAEFGVPASVITGFWALESDFGSVGMGKYQILRSLATLAYDCRRGPMFRDELKAALQIIDRGDLSPGEMIGSWAGEIGQTQFLPTRYLDHAVDYDKDGRINLFEDPTDIIGTTANYMTHLGWRRGEPWIQEVQVPDEMPWEESDLTIKHPRSKWAAWGVTRADGGPLEKDALPASLLLPMGRLGPAFLAYQNFDVYLQWNQSLNYATTAAYLATRIDGAPVMRRPADGIAVLGQEEAKELQRQLSKRGFDVGQIDGKLGLKSRQAIKAMQKKYKLPADSYPTPELLALLRRG